MRRLYLEVGIVSERGKSFCCPRACFDSFLPLCRVAQRDAARKRFEEKRNAERAAKMASSNERVNAIRDKDKATMEMFQQMAKARFG